MEKQKYFLYKCSHHAANLNSMRLKNKFCDVTIVVNGNKVLHAHKVVLVANLKYFENMCSNDSCEDVIMMETVEGADLEELISYAYTGEILLTDSNALGLLEVANYLHENEIKKACIEFLENHLKVEDSFRAYHIGDAIECHTLKNDARESILSNFQSCSQTEEYLDLDVDSLKDVLVGVKFNYAESQQMFFEGVARWITHALKERRNNTADLLRLIDTTKMKSDYMMKHLRPIADHRDNGTVKDAAVVTCAESQRTTYQLEDLDQVLSVLGNYNYEPHVQFYRFTEKKWSPPQPIVDAKRMYSHSAVLNGAVYYINRNVGRNHLQMLDPRTKHSARFYSSSSLLSFAAVCACKEFLYLCGGKKFVVEFNQVTRYDPAKNSFETLAPMKTKRSHAVAIIYEGCLHVLGGRAGLHRVTSVEKYDPREKNWTTLASMNDGRYGHAAAVLDGKLYVCGGYDIKSVEVYDPFNDIWQPVARMNKKRYHFFVVAHMGRLLAIGGDKEMTVEVYYPRNNEWEIDHELSSGLQILEPSGGLIKNY